MDHLLGPEPKLILLCLGERERHFEARPRWQKLRLLCEHAPTRRSTFSLGALRLLLRGDGVASIACASVDVSINVC